jgi:lysozyme family protein
MTRRMSIMANFESAIKQTLIHEGGYNEVKGDAGGATNFGISLRFLKGLDDNLDLADINHDGKIDTLDIKNLTEEHAKKIYFEEFWKANKCDLIKDDAVAAKFFDMSVNMGLKQATKLLQRACNHFKIFGLTVDGKIGNKTLQAVNQTNPEQLLNVIRKECQSFYIYLVDEKPAYEKFLKGWLRRAMS